MTRRSLLLSPAGLVQAKPKPYGLAYSFKGFPHWPLEKSFALCAELGYNGVELFVGFKQDHEPGKLDVPALRRLVQKHRLPVVTLMEDLRLTGDDQPIHLQHLEASLKLAREIDPKHPPLIETVVGGRPEEWDKLKPLFLERLKAWARLADKYKVLVTIKPHIGSALHLPEQGAELCRQVASRYLQLNYDFSHFQLQGLDLEQSIRAELPYIGMVHIKDSIVTDASTRPPKFRFALPGEGNIDYPKYVATLRKLNYRAPVVVEVSTQVIQRPGFDPEAAARLVATKVLPAFSATP